MTTTKSFPAPKMPALTGAGSHRYFFVHPESTGGGPLEVVGAL